MHPLLLLLLLLYLPQCLPPPVHTMGYAAVVCSYRCKKFTWHCQYVLRNPLLLLLLLLYLPLLLPPPPNVVFIR